MKGATLKAKLERLGILASYSRPGVSDDNPYVESLFGTMKSRVGYPKKPFETLEEAQAWVNRFVGWYNEEHRHSALNWVTPMARHTGAERELLRFSGAGTLHRHAARAYSALGSNTKHHYHQGEYYAWAGDLRGAVLQMELAAKAADGDFYQSSVVETRLRALRRDLAEQQAAMAKNG